eukprot:gene1081-15414_t
MSSNGPVVTGISPAEGPPGTKVKIRGENLGKNASDLIGVFICNKNCTYTAEWHPHYITCRTGLGLGNGSIVVVTKSGGKGTSTVKFRGYMPRVGLLTESAVWVDESKLFDEKPTSGLSISRPLSPNFSENDPLGVAPSETGAVIPPDKIDEMYPKSSGNPLSENFHPARFLLEKHLDTSFDALRSGFYHLESQDTRSYSGPASLVRSNLGTILDSLDILGEIQRSVSEDKQDSPGGSITKELEGILKNCDTVANSMFKDILSRKDDADAKRNALNVLQRFKFLFNLQRNIEKNLQQGDFEIVISDYNRAKALFQNSEVKSFQKALEKVDGQISAFMVQLKERLFEFPSVLEEKRRLIRYLSDLDSPGDPAWECIAKMQQWIKGLFLESKDHHQKNDVANRLSPPLTPQLDVRPSRSEGSRLGAPSEFPSKHRRTPSEGSRPVYLKPIKKQHSRSGSLTYVLPDSISPIGQDDASIPNGIQFIEELCELIVGNMPDLLQLGKAYLSGEIGSKAGVNVNAAGESQVNIAKYTKKFSDMISEIVTLFCNLVNGVLRPSVILNLKERDRSQAGGWAKTDLYVAYFPNCGRQISGAYETLKSLGLPEDSVVLLGNLATNVSEQCVKEVLQSTLNNVKLLEHKETWVLVYDENNTCISKLPISFEKMVSDCISFIKNFMHETTIEEKEKRPGIRKHVADSTKKLVEAFLHCLQNISEREEEFDRQRSSPGTQKDIATEITLDKKFLVCLSNCNYLHEFVLPKLGSKCSKCGFEELANIKTAFSSTISNFDNKLFDKFIEHKGDPLVGSIEQGMLLGEYRWEDSTQTKGVRPYLREVIQNLVVIHDQVSSISSSFVKRIFQKIGAMLAEEVQRIFECYSKFSESGALQAFLEISVFEGFLRYNLAKDSQKVNEMVTEFNKQMFFQLSCFWPAQEVQRFAEMHGLLSDFDEKRSQSFGSKDRPVTKLSSKETGQASSAPPKAARGKKNPTASIAVKETESATPPAKPARDNDADSSSIRRSDPVLCTKPSQKKKLVDIAHEKKKQKPPVSHDGNNPFLEDSSNPFEEKEPSNPFEDDTSNPFLDSDEGGAGSGNPFLD